MAKYAIDSATLTGIADAIREKTKTTATVQTSKMAESILAIKGGLSVDVVTASALPGTVVDGQIVVITDTTPGAVYIDTDEPASPLTGDVWVKMDSGANATLVLTEDPPYVQGGLAEAMQRDGASWIPLEGYLGDTGVWKQFSQTLPPVGTPLNDMSWEDISQISQKGLGQKYFSVGDAKEITINGTVGNTTFSDYKIFAFIIGFDHNSDNEGKNTIHFQIGKSEQLSGANLSLVDTRYSNAAGAGQFCMNTSADNTGGWAESNMRKNILGGGHVPSEPLTGSLLAALPNNLREVMRVVKKYTDNVGGTTDTASNVKPTDDYLWLLSEFEVFGSSINANSAEKDYQKQYAYYSAGNSKVFNRHTSPTTTAIWWLRSVTVKQYAGFCGVRYDGSINNYAANISYGVTPCFCV